MNSALRDTTPSTVSPLNNPNSVRLPLRKRPNDISPIPNKEAYSSPSPPSLSKHHTLNLLPSNSLLPTPKHKTPQTRHLIPLTRLALGIRKEPCCNQSPQPRPSAKVLPSDCKPPSQAPNPHFQSPIHSPAYPSFRHRAGDQNLPRQRRSMPRDRMRRHLMHSSEHASKRQAMQRCLRKKIKRDRRRGRSPRPTRRHRHLHPLPIHTTTRP
ncbi:hypothetical protein EJ06DRAFT_532271 [Trichodelitschia bisporula]|uniref:Uncharacterized protein n=1 Tax=Trichodelitschia bisporula TaxID=703511 RepID=A0A6G1HR52_9PEZI|nr:hypothetical protein EJ06DRAFT_532271 [Trichodelitschia bisporula]